MSNVISLSTDSTVYVCFENTILPEDLSQMNESKVYVAYADINIVNTDIDYSTSIGNVKPVCLMLSKFYSLQR